MIQYNFGQIAQASQDIRSTSAKIATLLDQLKQDIAPMVNEWEGDSATAYQVAQRNWDQSAEELNTVLNSVSQAVEQSNTRMSQLNSRVASSWQ